MKEDVREPRPEAARGRSALRKKGHSSTFFIDSLMGVAVVGDLIFFFCGLVLSYFSWFKWAPQLHERFHPQDLTIFQYSGHLLFGSIFFCLIAVRSGLYSRQNILRLRRINLALLNTVAYWTLGYLFLSLLFYFQPPISRMFVLLGATWGTLLIYVWRNIFHTILLREDVASRVRQRILVVGWNSEAERFSKSVFNDASHPYEIIGCLPSAHNEYRVQPPGKVKRLGTYADINHLIKSQNVEIVLMADLDPKTHDIVALCEICNREMIQFKVIPSYFQILISGLHLETISGVPVLGVARLPLDYLLNRIIKRTIDIVGAIVGLLLTVPILLIFGTLVYLESPGPIIYRQIREGRQGRPFTLYKIRSMRLDAEKVGGAQWSRKGDPRCLRIGTILREWNLDEFPQFWNVLKGDMSLVGPRPERPELIEGFKDEIRNYNARHYVKPGLTGWAQVNGLRGDTDLNERIRYDLYYLENWSPMLDFYTMARTFFKAPSV